MKHWIPILLVLPFAASAQLPDDLEPGAWVEVEARGGPAGHLVADEVGIAPMADSEDRVRGRLESQTPLVIAGVRVVLSPAARPTNVEGEPIELSRLEPGMRVDARGRYAQGVLQASHLVVQSSDSKDVDLEGAISAVDADADSIRVLGIDVQITRETWVGLD